MPNFSSLAGLEVPEKFVVVVVGGKHVGTVSNPTKLLLSYFELHMVLTIWKSAKTRIVK